MAGQTDFTMGAPVTNTGGVMAGGMANPNPAWYQQIAQQFQNNPNLIYQLAALLGQAGQAIGGDSAVGRLGGVAAGAAQSKIAASGYQDLVNRGNATGRAFSEYNPYDQSMNIGLSGPEYAGPETVTTTRNADGSFETIVQGQTRGLGSSSQYAGTLASPPQMFRPQQGRLVNFRPR